MSGVSLIVEDVHSMKVRVARHTERLEASLDQGRVLVATDGGHVVGYLQLTGDELKSMAVAEDRQHHGIGRALVEHAVRIWRHEGFRTVRVATATASIDNLRFYQ